jgi:hypothetical protein
VTERPSILVRGRDGLILALRWLHANRALALFFCVGFATAGLLFRAYPYPFLNGLEDAEHEAKVLAILIGGLWVLYQFGLRRAFESGLSIKVKVRSAKMESVEYAVLIEIEFANVGSRRIVCAKRLLPSQIHDYEHSIEHPCDLELRPLKDLKRTGTHVDWWGTRGRKFDHVSVLEEYSTRKGLIDFFMEPGEEYRIGQVFVLPSGHYLAKVVFVGNRLGAAEYWSQMTHFRVPENIEATRDGPGL